MSTSGPTRVVEVDGEQLRAVRRRARRTSGSTARAPDDARRAARRRRTPRSRARILAGEPGPRARSRACSTPARRSTSPAASDIARGGRARRARRRSTTAAPQRALDGYLRADARSWPRVSVLDRDRRSDDPRRASTGASTRACRSRSSNGALVERARRGPRPFTEALARPGVSRDRRAQAPLAERRRRSAPARRSRRSSRAYERGGAAALSVLTEGRALRRLARRPARRSRGQRACRSCARTSSSTATSWSKSAVAGADAILLIVAALERRGARASCTRGGRRSTSTCSSRSTTTQELERALERSTPT